VVRADSLVYTDENRLAHYTGGVTLVRPLLREKSRELRAYLAESGADSRLEKAIADGDVEITQIASDHTRVGTAQHSEYLVTEDRVTLTGGPPRYADTCNGAPCGSSTAPGSLTYIASEKRTELEGSGSKLVESRIIHKKKK
jgi:lipopolysaccharide export system protein LptA